jgi:hypothetical protein
MSGQVRGKLMDLWLVDVVAGRYACRICRCRAKVPIGCRNDLARLNAVGNAWNEFAIHAQKNGNRYCGSVASN